MPVNIPHPAYRDASEKWKIVRAIIDNSAMEYLAEVDPNDPLRTEQYKNNALLTNFTKLTRDGLLGLIFLSDPKITLPPELNYLLKDATGSGLSLIQLAQLLCGDIMETGKFGILVDHSRQDISLNIETPDSCRLIPYNAESILNWRLSRVNGQDQLILLVLQEQILVQSSEKDEFVFEFHPQYRVLRLTNGVYTQQLYNRELQPVGPVVTPTKADGSTFNYIPFGIFGTENNDMACDNPTLYDLARLNLQHYRNSADLEESIFIVGQPTPVINIGDIPYDQWEAANGGKFKSGSRGGIIVGLGGQAQLLQAQPNNLVTQAMKDKIADAVSIGGRLIAPPGGRETADAARIRYSSQNSALYILTKNVNRGLVAILKWACDFTKGADPSNIDFILNDQFYEEGADYNLIAQAWMGFDRGVITAQEIRDYIASSGTGLILEDQDLEEDNLDIGTNARSSSGATGDGESTQSSLVTVPATIG